jgi:DNA-binding transcriptional regulator GbsR (MarR family)
MVSPRKTANTETAPAGKGGASVGGGLTPVRREIVDMCADALQQLGLPRSVGQIFGVIYGSPQPLAFADVVEYLEISNGSASQGLRFLRELGAVRVVADPEGRRELFVPETELRRLLGGVLKQRFREPLEAAAGRLQSLDSGLTAQDEPHREFLEQRISSLRTWHRKALRILPLLQTFLRNGKG